MVRSGKSTLRLSGLKAEECSGLTLSGASLPRLQRWVVWLSSCRSLSAAEWVKKQSPLSVGILSDWQWAFVFGMFERPLPPPSRAGGEEFFKWKRIKQRGRNIHQQGEK